MLVSHLLGHMHEAMLKTCGSSRGLNVKKCLDYLLVHLFCLSSYDKCAKERD